MKKIVSALVISAAAFSAPAFATGFMDTPVGSKYISADAGLINYSSNSATAVDVGFGYQVSQPVGIEVDYLHGGAYSYNFGGFPGTIQLTALQVMAVGRYNFGSGWGAYAKAGISHNNYKSTTVIPFFGAVTGSATSNDLAVAIGGTYQVANNIKLRAQYMETGVSSVNTLTFGAQFGF